MIDTAERSMSKPGLETARRLEIFTGAGRRRRWPAAVKAQIVAESYSEAVTVSEVARRYGLCGAQLFAWRRQARSGPLAGDERGFVPVVLSACEDEPARTPVAGSVTIEIGDAVLHVPAGLEPASITALIRAIRAAS
jgi:transposase